MKSTDMVVANREESKQRNDALKKQAAERLAANAAYNKKNRS